MLKISTKKKLFVIPDHYLGNFVTDIYLHLAHVFAANIDGLELIKSSEFNPRSDLELVVLVSFVHWYRDDMRKIYDLPSNVKIILWNDDLGAKDDKSKVMIEDAFAKAHLIVSGTKYAFLELWSEYEHKMFWLPFFASPYFHQDYNKNPKIRCLLSGHCSIHHYPLRHKVKNANHPFVDVVDHPGYQVDMSCSSKRVRNKYAALLNSYFCCVTDSGRTYGALTHRITGERRTFAKPVDDYLKEKMGEIGLERFKNRGQVLLKYFEIPASGSLLIADECAPEMMEIGYKPNVNFVPVNQDNVFDVIEDCCRNPDKYEAIRHNGWLQSKEHTLEDRVHQLKKILKTANVEVR